MLMLSDLSSGLVATANAYILEKRLPIKIGLYNTLAFIAGRWVSVFLSGSWFDTVSFSLVTPGLKNDLAVFLARALIAKLSHESEIWAKSWTCVLTDMASERLMQMIGISDRALIAA